MKPYLSAFLTAVMLLSLCACGSAPLAGASAPAAGSSVSSETSAPALQVGFGRIDITPELGGRKIPLGGFPNADSRRSNSILSEEDRIYATCVALADDSGQTLLLLTLDVLSINDTQARAMRNRITEATGVPAEHIQIACTHTHSGPLVKYLGSDYMAYTKFFIQSAMDCAVAAFADLAPAQMYTGSTQVENMNWVRHYKLSDGTIAGDNFGHWGQGLAILSHATQADQQMQLIRFEREGEDKKDVVMVNWQAHPTTSSTTASEYGKQNHKNISADYIGHCRSYVESQTDCLFAFYQGAAGNLNARSNIAAEQALCSEDSPTYGKQLGDYVLHALDTLTARQAGLIQSEQRILSAKSSSGAADVELELNAVSVGPVAFVTAPYEMFDTSGMHIKGNSPYETTFVLELANGSAGGYVPVADVYDYDPTAYEVTASEVVKGTAEMAANELVDMLQQQYDAVN